MAKYEKQFRGNFDQLLDWFDESITKSSISARYEDGSDFTIEQIKLATRVYERYSLIGGNRVSLTITLLGNGPDLFISAITSGGSQAVFFKMNTFGEEAFLDVFIKAVETYISQYQET